MDKLLQNRVVFLPGEADMRDVIRTMRDKNISSVLITDQQDMVSGIITERDIVQKFTLLELPDKLSSKANAVMNRPVMMARVSHLFQDIIGLFKSRGFRHFPVTTGGYHKKNVLGIMTVTDIASAWLTAHGTAPQPTEKIPLVIICGEELQTKNYDQLFSSLGLSTLVEGKPDDLLREAVEHQTPILLDIDYMPLDMAKRCLGLVKKHSSVLLLLSSDPKLVAPLKDHLHGPLTSVCLKPLDISQILRTIRQIEDLVTPMSA